MSRKKRKHQKAAERQRREMERLQQAIARQAEEAAASPKPSPEQLSPPVEEITSTPLPEFDAPELTGDDLWDEFQQADLPDQQAIFLRALEAGELDDEYAFEMLETIHGQLDNTPAGRALYAELVGQLQDKAPELYKQSAGYYNTYLIKDAIENQHWEALPVLLVPYVEEPERSIETFIQVQEQLRYHGQLSLLIQVMQDAWPQLSQSSEVLPWAIEEFAGDLMHAHLFHYLEMTPSPQVNDPVLLEVTAPYGDWKEGWLERFVPPMSAPAPSAWQPEDFGLAVDADRWDENQRRLLTEFVADRHRAGIPISRAFMVLEQLSMALEQQFATSALPTLTHVKRRYKGKRSRSKTQQPTLRSFLIPSYATMDKILVDLFPFLSGYPYKAAAVVEALPAYLHFLARLGLIHPTEMDAAFVDLRRLLPHSERILESYGADNVAIANVLHAWSDDVIQTLRDDPLLGEAREKPPVSLVIPEQPPRKPGALQTYTFKVTYLRDPEVWRIIEISERQNLHDLHGAIQEAVNFDNDHLYSFYLSGRAWDKATEYAHPSSDGPSAARLKMGDLNLRMKQRILYLFDYGDEHHFTVQLVAINSDAPQTIDYPRIVERHGDDPEQYPGWDDEEEWDEEEWDEEEWDEEDWDEEDLDDDEVPL